MKHPADETELIGLLETLGTLTTGDELTAWADTDLQGYFPHGAFICGIGRIHSSGVQPIRVFSSHFPQDYLRALEQPNGYLLSPVMKNWLDSGETTWSMRVWTANGLNISRRADCRILPPTVHMICRASTPLTLAFTRLLHHWVSGIDVV